jgi:DNA/RNA-binding domain of Phe-tRNA-synthetase-like protein
MTATATHIHIHDQLVRYKAALATIEASVTVTDSNASLRAELEDSQAIAALGTGDGSACNERSIAATRQIVCELGWNVNRYRVSSEALLRRIRRGDRVPSVNNIVDINNILSIQSGLPIGTYSLSRLQPPVEFRIGRSDEEYSAIGGAAFKLKSLPLFADLQGPFGSVVRDSGRAIIDNSTTKILMVVVGFDNFGELEEIAQRATVFLRRFATASSLDVSVFGRSQV